MTHHPECPFLEDPEKSCLCQYLNPRRDEARARNEDALVDYLEKKRDPYFQLPTYLAEEIMAGNPPPGVKRTLATGIMARDLVIEKLLGIVDVEEEPRSTCEGCGCDTSRYIQNHSADCEYFPL